MSSPLNNILPFQPSTSSDAQEPATKKQCTQSLAQVSQPNSSEPNPSLLSWENPPKDVMLMLAHYLNSNTELQKLRFVSRQLNQSVIEHIKRINSIRLLNLCNVITSELRASLIIETVKATFPTELNNVPAQMLEILEKEIANHLILDNNNDKIRAVIKKLAIDQLASAKLEVDESTKIAEKINELVLVTTPFRTNITIELKPPFTIIEDFYIKAQSKSKSESDSKENHNSLLNEVHINQFETSRLITNYFDENRLKTDNLKELYTNILEIMDYYTITSWKTNNLKSIIRLFAVGRNHIKNVLRILNPKILTNVKSRQLELPFCFKNVLDYSITLRNLYERIEIYKRTPPARHLIFSNPNRDLPGLFLSQNDLFGALASIVHTNCGVSVDSIFSQFFKKPAFKSLIESNPQQCIDSLVSKFTDEVACDCIKEGFCVFAAEHLTICPVTLANAITDVDIRNHALTKIAVTYAKTADTSNNFNKEELIVNIEYAVYHISNQTGQDKAYEKALLEMIQYRYSLQMCDELERIIYKISEEKTQERCFKRLILRLRKYEQYESALKILNNHDRTSFTNGIRRDVALKSVRNNFQNAIKFADSIKPGRYRDITFRELSKAVFDYERAKECANKISDSDRKAKALAAIEAKRAPQT